MNYGIKEKTRNFNTNVHIITLLYILNLFFVILLILEKMDKIMRSAGNILKISYIVLNYSFIIINIFLLLFVYELFFSGLSEGGISFNPFLYIKKKRKYLLYNFYIYLIELTILITVYFIFKEKMLNIIALKENGLVVKAIRNGFIYGVIYYLIRILFFSGKFESIGFKNNLSNGMEKVLFSEEKQREYGEYYFKYLVPDGIILVFVILIFTNLIIYLSSKNPSLIKYYIYNYITSSFIFFFYSVFYMKRKGYRGIKYPFICFLPFGFLFLMFYPAKKEIVEKENKD